MSKGLINRRDKMLWDNSNKPDISDVVAEIDDEMDDLLEDHDDTVVEIVDGKMNDLLDDHDDKVVSIVGDNMTTLLNNSASVVKTLAQIALSTETPYKIGTFGDASVYVKAFTGTFTGGAWVTAGSIPTTAAPLGLFGVAVSSTRYYNLGGYSVVSEARTDVRVDRTTGNIQIYAPADPTVTTCEGIIIYSIEED